MLLSAYPKALRTSPFLFDSPVRYPTIALATPSLYFMRGNAITSFGITSFNVVASKS
jgi:hypothetical protein